MYTPFLISPADGASFWPDEMIQFKWQLGDMQVLREKFNLYIGTNPIEPWNKEYRKAVRRWELQDGVPETLLTSYNETADRLGLDPRQTYYWMVAQENYGHGMTRVSGVRAIQIKGQRLQGRLQFGFRNPTTVARGTPINISIQIDNTSDDPIRLFFPTPHHFEVVISRLHLIGQDEHIWSAPVVSVQVIDIVKIQPHQSYKEVVTWPQVDMQNRPVDAGSYFVRVHCNADDFHVEGKEGFSITG